MSVFRRLRKCGERIKRKEKKLSEKNIITKYNTHKQNTLYKM